jgi:plasmid maintenance system killer protein
MDLSFQDDALEHRCACEEASVRTWGAELARIIRRRLVQLTAADSLAVVRTFPFCTLAAAEDGRYVLHSGSRLRIVFSTNADGPDPDVDAEAETREICVLAIEIADDD